MHADTETDLPEENCATFKEDPERRVRRATSYHRHELGRYSTLRRLSENARTLLANSPDWLKAAPMRENLLASWRQFGQKQDPCPSLLNHNAKYKRLLPPYCDFANGVRPFLVDTQEIGKELRHGLGSRYKKTVARSSACDIDLFDLFETCVVGS